MSIYAQESVLLRLKYQKGDIYSTEVKMKQISPTMTNDMVIYAKAKVTDVKNGKFITENRSNKVTMDMSAMGNTIHYDSTMDESKMDEMVKGIHAQMKPFISSTFSVTYDELGQYSDVAILKGNADIEQFKEGLKSSTVHHPQKAVKVGSHWSKKNETNGSELNTTYTVSKIDTDFVYLSINGKITGMATGTLTGTAKIDRKTGTLVSSNTKNTINSMGQEIKIDITILGKLIRK
ncbi:MAG: hypothetical protein CSA38_01635 [Flavobacteriales bacterium]|nr:MAG: hypothetical protein CSA38_01635 [Flavobacteriales bacterium]